MDLRAEVSRVTWLSGSESSPCAGYVSVRFMTVATGAPGSTCGLYATQLAKSKLTSQARHDRRSNPNAISRWRPGAVVPGATPTILLAGMGLRANQGSQVDPLERWSQAVHPP